MKKNIIIILILWSIVTPLKAQENIYSDEILQLKNLNNELSDQLLSATKEIGKLQKENSKLQISDEIKNELAKTKKELENKSYEVRVLRQKLMISKDAHFYKSNKI